MHHFFGVFVSMHAHHACYPTPACLVEDRFRGVIGQFRLTKVSLDAIHCRQHASVT